MYAGTPAEDWFGIWDYDAKKWLIRPMSQAQRNFAYKCIEWGEKNYGMGHTLAAIAWMESSLGEDTDHGEEKSYGPFGLSRESAAKVLSTSDFARKPVNRRDLEGNHELAATASILIFADNIRYIRQWHRNRELTITDREAWQKASQVYPGRTNWQNRAEYGRIFRLRVAFLRILTKE